MTGSGNAVYDGLVVDEQLGHLEYVVTQKLLAEFQEAVGYPEAGFPHIAVKEYIEVLRRKHGPVPIISAKHRDRYFHPPDCGEAGAGVRLGAGRSTSGGAGGGWWWRRWRLTRDGREIVRSEHTFLIGGLETGA